MALATAETTFDAGAQHRAPPWRTHRRADTARFGFWTPELLDARVPSGDIFLEILSRWSRWI